MMEVAWEYERSFFGLSTPCVFNERGNQIYNLAQVCLLYDIKLSVINFTLYGST